MSTGLKEKWSERFSIKKIGSTFYVALKHTKGKAISPDFPTKGQARTWIKNNWEAMIFEAEVLRD